MAISYTSILLPLGLGALLALRLRDLMPSGVSMLSYVLFMGAAMSITAFHDHWTDHDRAALRLAKRIGENTGAEITILHVVAPGATPSGDAERHTRDELTDGEEGKRYTVVFKTVTHAVPGEAAIDESRNGYDLLRVGMGRQWGLEHKSFGPRAEAILARAPISIMVVRNGQRRPAEAKAVDEGHRARFATVA